jgi:hypothetical protein
MHNVRNGKKANGVAGLLTSERNFYCGHHLGAFPWRFSISILQTSREMDAHSGAVLIQFWY